MAGGYSDGNVRTRHLLPEKFGVTPRAIYHLFDKKRKEEEKSNTKIVVSVYFVEIYNNKLRDLLRRVLNPEMKKAEIEELDKKVRVFYEETKKEVTKK